MRHVWIVIIAVLTAGCAAWQGPRTPDLVASQTEEALQPEPVIKLEFSHVHMMEGDSGAPFTGGGMSETAFRDSLERVSKDSPLMTHASLAPDEPVHYVLFLDTSINEHGQALAILGGLSFGLFPVIPSSDVGVTGVLYEATSGERVGVYEAQGKLKVLLWLPLLPFTPVTLFLGPGYELYDDTYKDLFIQISRDLKDQPLPEAVEASRLEIEEEVKYKERQIRLR